MTNRIYLGYCGAPDVGIFWKVHTHHPFRIETRVCNLHHIFVYFVFNSFSGFSSASSTCTPSLLASTVASCRLCFLLVVVSRTGIARGGLHLVLLLFTYELTDYVGVLRLLGA